MTYTGAAYRGVVTRAGTSGVFVQINSHWPGVEFGPCDLVANVVRIGPLTTAQATTSSNGDPAHTHTVTSTVAQTEWFADLIEEGDNVLAMETGPDDFLIVGVIRSGVSASGGAG